MTISSRTSPTELPIVPEPPRPLPGRHTEQAQLDRLRHLHRALMRDRLADGTASLGTPTTHRDDRPSRLALFRQRGANLSLGALIGLIVATVTAIGSATGPARFDDEGTYVSQALAVLEGSLAPYTYWYDHPPLGWIVLAGWMGTFGKIFEGPNLIATARIFMVVVTLVSTVALVMLVRRLGGTRPTAVLAGLAFGLSPLAVQYHRMVMLDNIAVMFLLIGWLLAATTSKRLITAILAGAFLSCAVLTKETLLLTAPFMAWMAWKSYVGPTRRMSVAAFLLTFVLGSSFYPLFAAVRGELLPGKGHVSLWDGVIFQLFTREGSGSLFDPTSNAHTVFSGWLSADTYLLAFGLMFLIPALLNARVRPIAAAGVLSALMMLRGGYLPVAYVVVLLALAAVVGALGLETVVRFILRPFDDDRDTNESTALAVRFSAIAVLVVVAIGLGQYVPRIYTAWTTRDAVYMRHDFDQPTRSATDWLRANVSDTEILVADNVVWTDLVDASGRPQASTVWFTKIDADPDVKNSVRKWTDINYVVVSDIMRASDQTYTLRQAMEHSTVVQAWGTGSERVEIRKVSAG